MSYKAGFIFVLVLLSVSVGYGQPEISKYCVVEGLPQADARARVSIQESFNYGYTYGNMSCAWPAGYDVYNDLHDMRLYLFGAGGDYIKKICVTYRDEERYSPDSI